MKQCVILIVCADCSKEGRSLEESTYGCIAPSRQECAEACITKEECEVIKNHEEQSHGFCKEHLRIRYAEEGLKW